MERIPSLRRSIKQADTIVNPALAKTLRAIAEKGNEGFYDGWVAQAMVNKPKQQAVF